MPSVVQRLKDVATSEAELRHLWQSLGLSPAAIERAIMVKNREPADEPVPVVPPKVRVRRRAAPPSG